MSIRELTGAECELVAFGFDGPIEEVVVGRRPARPSISSDFGLQAWIFLAILFMAVGASICDAHDIHPDNRVMERPSPIFPATLDEDLLVEADFDGNGVQDSAFYIKDEEWGGDYSLYMLVVYMNDGEQTFEIASMVGTGITGLSNSGILVAEPGAYANSCSSGPEGYNYGEDRCAEVTGDLQLQNPAISSVRYEVSASILYWN